MKKLNPVDRPDRTVIVHKNDVDYVYFTEKVVYSPEKKRSSPRRVYIGKLNDEGKLLPNQNYIDIFGAVEERVDPYERGDFISAGLHCAVDDIANKLQLRELLESIFGENSKKILDIAMYMIAVQDNAMYCFEDYGYCHSLFNGENFSDSSIGRLFDEITVKNIDLFIKSWVNIYAKKDIYISYDSTNMNSVAGNLELVEYGHAKDNSDLPQINVSLGYNQTDNLPLMYEIYSGSIIDNTECQKMVDRAVYYGCENIGFILDRGYFSIENIKYFERYGFDYILMTKGNARFVQEAVNEVGAVLKNGVTHYLPEYEIYGTTVEKELFSAGHKQYVHVYYNGVQAEKEKIQFNSQLGKIENTLSKKIEEKIQRREDVKTYETYYRMKFDDNGYFLNYQRKDKNIKETVDRMGYFVIVTSKKMNAEQALNIYRDRDAVEKVFRMEKSYLGCDVFRVHTTDKLESKMFVSFIALIIRNEISKKTKKLYQSNRSEYTIQKIVQQLERLGLTRLSDEKYHERYNLTSRQKKILNALEIKEAEYHKFVEEAKKQVK